MELEVLKKEVVSTLVSYHEFTFEEAEEAVGESVKDNEEIWNENAIPKDLATYLASDENE
jgi:predicted RNA polymerase sigma factor